MRRSWDTECVPKRQKRKKRPILRKEIVQCFAEIFALTEKNDKGCAKEVEHELKHFVKKINKKIEKNPEL